MSIFVLDLILSAVMIGLLVYLVIASTPLPSTVECSIGC
jgi:hypothetical protein